MTREEIKVPIQLLEGATAPAYARDGDAGMDVYANEDVLITPGQTKAVGIGIKAAIPDGYEFQVRPRSGVSAKTALRVANAPGTIDSGFRDEIKILLSNTATQGTSNLSTLDAVDGDKEYFVQNGSFQIRKGDRVAQLVLQAVPKAVLEVTDDVSTIGKNRGGGLGSTGVRGSAEAKPNRKASETEGK